jgi:hypothetical protein
MLIVRPAVSSQRAAAEARQPGRDDTACMLRPGSKDTSGRG